MCSERTSADTVTTAASTALELDDIQSGMFHQRPASYVGTSSCFASTTARRGGSWSSGCSR